jgi:hypothetical protein
MTPKWRGRHSGEFHLFAYSSYIQLLSMYVLPTFADNCRSCICWVGRMLLDSGLVLSLFRQPRDWLSLILGLIWKRTPISAHSRLSSVASRRVSDYHTAVYEQSPSMTAFSTEEPSQSSLSMYPLYSS